MKFPFLSSSFSREGGVRTWTGALCTPARVCPRLRLSSPGGLGSSPAPPPRPASALRSQLRRQQFGGSFPACPGCRRRSPRAPTTTLSSARWSLSRHCHRVRCPRARGQELDFFILCSRTRPARRSAPIAGRCSPGAGSSGGGSNGHGCSARRWATLDHPPRRPQHFPRVSSLGPQRSSAAGLLPLHGRGARARRAWAPSAQTWASPGA